MPVAVDTHRVLMISSDAHATARMDDYKPYIPPSPGEEFESFCDVYREKGARINEEATMSKSFDIEFMDLWRKNVLEPGRLEGTWPAGRGREENRAMRVAGRRLF
jgi:hypothetical protein